MTNQSFATAADGTRIAYRLWGKTENTQRVALIHALAMTTAFWEETAAELATDCAVLAIDCRGHGASDKPSGPYSVEQFADDLAAVMKHCNWDSAIIGGASMGGCVAQAFAHLYSDRTEGLALIDTTAWYGTDAVENWEGRAQKAVEGGMSALVDFQKSRWFSDDFRRDNPDKVEVPVRIFMQNDVRAYVETCRMLGRCDMRATNGAIDMPVEIMVGEEDYATPLEMAQALHDSLPTSKLTQLDGARHFTPMEVPKIVSEKIRRLFERG